MTIKWDRPSGQELETNDKEETIKYLEAIGYKQIVKQTPIEKRPQIKLNNKKAK
jgi:hypothetical protein